MPKTLRRHPLTGAPLAPIGIFRGRVVWPIMGGSETATEAPPASGEAPAASAATPPPAAAPPAAPAGDVTDEDAAELDAERLAAKYTPKQLAAYTLRLRNEAGNARVAKNKATDDATKAAVDQLRPGLVALGLLKEDAPNDPAALAEQLRTAQEAKTASDVAAKTMQIENAVLRHAADPGLVQALGGVGVNPQRLLDSRSFGDTVAALDPAAADFRDKVLAAMKDAATKDAFFKAGPAPATRAGVPLNGGSGERTKREPTSLEDAVTSYYSS